MNDRAAHWEEVYATKDVEAVSWYQDEPKLSLDLIHAARPALGRVIDVGGGASRLVDRLLDRGYEDVAVFDISAVALEKAKVRLGDRAAQVRWIVGDVTTIGDLGTFDIWHDRAVFHFLTEAEDRRKYVELAARSVPAGGHLVIGTFAIDGPLRCSGLDVRRYDQALLCAEFGLHFQIVRTSTERHATPSGKVQSFIYALFVRQAAALAGLGPVTRSRPPDLD